MLGKVLASRGRHGDASGYLKLASATAPSVCAQHIQLQLAWSLWHAGRQPEAEATYWEVLDDDVLCWQALVDRARMHLGNGAWAEALRDLAQVAAMGKADADVCNDLGVSHFESGDIERAAHFFGEAIAKSPEHAPALSNRANCYKRQGDLREAENDYTRAIELDAKNPKAYQNRGLLLKEQGMNSRALRDYEKALALDKNNPVLQAEVKALTEKLAGAGMMERGGGGGARDRGASVSAAASSNAAGRLSIASHTSAAGGEGALEGAPLRRERL